VSEDPIDLGDRGREIVRQINEHTDEGLGQLAGVPALEQRIADLEAWRTQVDANMASLTEQHAALVEVVRLLSDRVTDEAERVTALDQALTERLDAQQVKIDAQAAMIAGLRSDLTAQGQLLTDHEDRITRLEQGQGAGSWRDQDDLIDTSFRPVLGVHTGGESQKSDPAVISTATGHAIQAAPIYWKTSGSPLDACNRMLRAGTLPRLELCLPHIFTSTGGRMGGTFWRDVGAGGHDDWIRALLTEVGKVEVPILLSFGHESDLRSEDGASPKTGNPPADTYCGSYEDFPKFWERCAAIARELAPKARLFLNLSGGYSGAPSRWAEMLPARDTFDFFGYDFYNQFGNGSGDWDSFEERLKMFGRWDWYRRTLPDMPLIIGETATCEGGARYDAGKWLLDLVEFMVANRWQGVGTAGGISQIHYFSHHYDSHPRCLDDGGTHKGCDSGQRAGVLPQIGADARLGWA
jgi:hypothetical protein